MKGEDNQWDGEGKQKKNVLHFFRSRLLGVVQEKNWCCSCRTCTDHRSSPYHLDLPGRIDRYNPDHR